MTTVTRTPTFIHCSPMEIAVLKALMIDGADNDTIARRLDRGVETVKTHMSRLLKRLGMPTRTAVVVAIWRRDIVVVDDNGKPVGF